MKKIFYISLAGLIFLSSCSKQQSEQSENLQKRLDSIQTLYSQQTAEMNDMYSFITDISNGLDSITQQEHIIKDLSQTESRQFNKNQLKANLQILAQTLETQRARLKQIEDTLSNRNGNITKFQNIVAQLNAQLDEKEQKIQKLMSEINKKNINIQNLQKQVSELAENNNTLNSTIALQQKALDSQQDAMNEGYVLVATKKQLKELGLLEGGFLSKKRLNLNNIDKSKFQKIDLRNFNQIVIDAQSPKILTSHPATSYTLTKQDGRTLLQITDKGSFWQVSSILIIQAK